VNNAGISGTGGPIEFIFRKELLNTFNINMASMAEVGRVFLPLLKESRGRLVNMVSMAGRVGMYNMGQYSASKFAMEGYSDCQRRELDPWGISVSIINPGYFRTAINNPEQLRKEKEAQWELVSEEVKEGYPDYANRSVAYAENLLTKVMSDSVYKVVDAYAHALFAKRPRLRYIVGNDGQVMSVLSLLPGKVLDRISKMVPRPMPPTISKR